MIVLGTYYMFFKKPPTEDVPDIAPEDRYKDTDAQ